MDNSEILASITKDVFKNLFILGNSTDDKTFNILYLPCLAQILHKYCVSYVFVCILVSNALLKGAFWQNLSSSDQVLKITQVYQLFFNSVLLACIL